YNSIKAIIEKFKPDVVAIEELFFFKNQKTVIPVAEARGILVLAANTFCGNIFEYTPLQIKQALTGQGRAEKKQVQYMVKSILNLDKIPTPDDAADALAVAICHGQINPKLNVNRL
ncbi:MAG: crossover junction endodeoxyribonuclease RuvC, partial [Clostridia bacterium]